MSTDYGQDISCTSGLRTGRYASGARLVAEAYHRRLNTPRGTLRGGEEEANYGLDLAAEVGRAVTNGTTGSLPGRIENELRKDERTETVKVTVVATVDGPKTAYAVSVDAVTSIGPLSAPPEERLH